jgi:putative ABC transport system substrate-binding protein
MVSRRTLLAGAVCCLALRGVAAQRRIYRIAYFAPGVDSPARGRDAFFARLEELGYRVGHNLTVDYRFAEGRLDRLPALAREVVAAKPDLIYSLSTQTTLAASRATGTIPIVFIAVTDPQGAGLVRSLRAPGTNVTGISNQADEAQVKLLQLLKDVFPSAVDVAVLYNPLNESEARVLRALAQASAPLGLRLRTLEASRPEEFAPAFRRLAAKRPDVLFVMAGPLADTERERIVALARDGRIAAVYGLSGFADAGGLMAYSFDFADQNRAAAGIVDKVLRGTNVAEIAVEQPTRFELVLNLATAKAQGIRFPSQVLLRADRLIQ